MNSFPVTPEEIEVRNSIQRAIELYLDLIKDDQINLAAECARTDIAKALTTKVLQVLVEEYRKDA